jgi:TolC family type I secretion outer membrane protein
MKVFVFSLTCILTVMVSGPLIARAADAGQPLTLGEAVAAALKQNPQVTAARHEEDAAAQKTIAARSGLLPQVYASETYNHTNSPLWAFGTKLNQGVIQSSDFNPDALNDPDPVDNFATALSMSWNLYDGGRTWGGWDQARQGEKIAAYALQRSQQQVMAQAAEAYIGLLLAVENHAVVVQALETARAHMKLVRDRFRAGLAVKSDVLRAQVRIADLEQQRLMAESQIQVAQAMLHAAMGQPDSGRIDPVTPIDQYPSTEGTLDQWIQQALDQRLELKQIAAREVIAAKEISRARAGHYPSLALQGNYEINSEDFNDSHDNYTVGAVLSMNLYSGSRISAQTAAAKSDLSKVKAMRRSLELGVRVETQRAFYQAQSAWKSIAVARQAVDQAEEGLRIVSNRYGGGLLTIVDLLDAQTALQQARTHHFKAMHDYRVARIELALAAGTITKDFE